MFRPHRWLLGLLILFSGQSFAVDYYWSYPTIGSFQGGNKSTPAGACTQYLDNYTATYPGAQSWVFGYVSVSGTSYGCYGHQNAGINSFRYTGSRGGDSFPTGGTYNATTGACDAPVAPDGSICTDASVPPQRVYQGGQCITLSTANQATQCKYFATSSGTTTRVYWIYEGQGGPAAPQTGSNSSGCEVVSVAPNLEKDCKYWPPEHQVLEDGTVNELPGTYKCKLSSTLTGNVAPDSSGVKPSDKICADPGSPACTLPDLLKDHQQRPAPIRSTRPARMFASRLTSSAPKARKNAAT